MLKKNKRKADPVDEEEYGLETSRKSKSARQRKQEPALLDEVSDDDESDLGHAVSQRFMASTKQLAKVDNATPRAVLEFDKLVGKRKQELLKRIEAKVQSILAEDTQLQQTVLGTLSRSLQPNVEGSMAKAGEKSRAPLVPVRASSIHQNAQSVIENAKEILTRYDYVQKQITSAKDTLPVTGEQEEGPETLRVILDKQSRHVKQDIELLLHGTLGMAKEGEMKISLDKFSLEEMQLWTGFGKDQLKGEKQGTRAEMETTWAEAAARAERNVRRLVKDLSENEE